MARPKKYTSQQVKKALQDAHGLKTGAAELLAANFETIDAYCKEFAMCRHVVEHWRKRRKDRAEYKLDEAIERGEAWAIMFTLKNAHDREYNDRVSVTFETMTDEQKRDYVRDLLAGGGFILAEPESEGLDSQADGEGGQVAESSPPGANSASG